LIVVSAPSLAFLVFPVSRYTFFGNMMHLFGAYLHLERLQV
jgi:hypothetical protein